MPSLRVLIVDDVPETRNSMQKLLFFEDDIEVVDTAGDGEEAVEKATTLKPDVVLIDVNMPKLDGFTATQKIVEAVPDCRVIMMSVESKGELLRRATAAGAKHVLLKPFSTDELVAGIRGEE